VGLIGVPQKREFNLPILQLHSLRFEKAPHARSMAALNDTLNDIRKLTGLASWTGARAVSRP
jgi:hypothetical protein